MTEQHRRKARILIVDDELGMREGCRRTLASQGHVVDTADSLGAGRDWVGRAAYDLALVDVMMPDGSGIDLIGYLHDKDPDTTCIIITGFATVEMAVEAIKRGAYDFLSKPFTTDQLIVAVNQGLERRWLTQEAHRLTLVEAQAAELARAKAELEALDQAKSQLMLKVAHELRAPTAAVQSYVSLILCGYVPQGELKPTLERVEERLKQMLDLVGDLLELARLKQAQGSFAAKAGPQPMAEVLREVVKLFENQAYEKAQKLEMDIVDEPVIVAEREHLTELWTNLISNAIKYTPQGGRIHVSLRSEGDQLIGVVEDTGMGIAEQDLPNLFQDFFRSDQAKACGEIGTGLGLSIVKQIVDSYRGEIRVSSQLGKGSCFTFQLPLDSFHAPCALPASGQIESLAQGE